MTDVQQDESKESKISSEKYILVAQTICSWLRAVHERCDNRLYRFCTDFPGFMNVELAH